MKATHTEYEFEYHHNIALYVHKSVPHEVFLATKAREFYDGHVAPRAGKLRQQKFDSQDVARLEAFRRAQLATRAEELSLPEAERGIVSSLVEIERSVETQRKAMAIARSEAVARTEALRVIGEANEAALRQSLEATGIGRELVGQEWNATRDGRTRDRHAARDGQRRRLGEPFDGGIMRPGDGPPEESVNCRCVLTTEIFDTEQELQAWLAGG